MLTDRYGLVLSTTSSAARDAYVEDCDAKLTMYPGAIEAFDRAIAADPGFALAHAAKAHTLQECGDAAAARASMAAANSLRVGLPKHEVSHIAFFGLLAAGDTEAALSALPAHLNAWPRDVLVLSTTAFTNGLIGNSGRAEQKRALLDLLESLASSYGDDWWFTAHHGMALSENSYKAPLYDVGIPSPDGTRRPFSGQPEEIAGDIRTFAAIGVHELIFDCCGQSIGESVERLQWLATDVL